MHIEIIVGSMLGATEYVADEIHNLLNENDISSTIHLEPQLADLKTDNLWFICTSTHGAGELPDNIQQFAQQLQGQQLNHVSYQIIGLGDSNYDTYCQGAITMDSLMQQSSARAIGEMFTVDVSVDIEPEVTVYQWLKTHLHRVIE